MAIGDVGAFIDPHGKLEAGGTGSHAAAVPGAGGQVEPETTTGQHVPVEEGPTGGVEKAGRGFQKAEQQAQLEKGQESLVAGELEKAGKGF